jgi:hypothetical protein
MTLILESGSTRFPPRLPEQPIFYPVLNQEYAEQIAAQWNAPSAQSGCVGFVTAFAVDARYGARFKAHTVGNALHRELWVPAEQLDEFNRHLVGPIRLLSADYGEEYTGPTPKSYMLKGRAAREQLPLLESIRNYSGMDFILEVRAQRLVVQLNFAYWVRGDFTALGLPLERKLVILGDVRWAWRDYLPDVALLGSDELDALEGAGEQEAGG